MRGRCYNVCKSNVIMNSQISLPDYLIVLEDYFPLHKGELALLYMRQNNVLLCYVRCRVKRMCEGSKLFHNTERDAQITS